MLHISDVSDVMNDRDILDALDVCDFDAIIDDNN
jgi:hypothetical protein